MAVQIWWIRRDLRLHDNPALAAAIEAGSEVVPLFILDPALLASPYTGEKRRWFLFNGLKALDGSLRARGSRLVLRRGIPHEVLAGVVRETGAESVFAQDDFSPYARRRDRLAAGAVNFRLTGGVTGQHPGAVLKEDGMPYTVFTPFSKRWKALYRPIPAKSAPAHLPGAKGLPSDQLPEPPRLFHAPPFPAGEAEALRRLDAFVSGKNAPIFSYRQSRDRMDLEGTSALSPYLRFGMLSPREAIRAAYRALETAGSTDGAKSAETWLNELIWREFYIAILHHFPFVREANFQAAYDNIDWSNDPDDFRAWCEGRTGFPIVDAAMRQLVTTGWMHNRARMITASFLTKELLIDWRRGERFFMQHLVDGDPAANNGGWQWTAGTGTDAAPYFRIFNPILQGKKFDPEGTYIRRWVTELEDVPIERVHTPWEMTPMEQREAGCRVGVNYPEPMIDRKWARERTLAAYKAARDRNEKGGR